MSITCLAIPLLMPYHGVLHNDTPCGIRSNAAMLCCHERHSCTLVGSACVVSLCYSATVWEIPDPPGIDEPRGGMHAHALRGTNENLF